MSGSAGGSQSGSEKGISKVRIGERWVGSGEPAFIIAEAGVNHNGQIELARELVDAAVDAGIDAVKFQTFKAECLVSPSAEQAAYQAHNTGRRESQLEMVRRLELSPEETQELEGYCSHRGIMFLSAPFDESSVDLLADLHVPAFKIGSGELTNHAFLSYVAGKGRPILLSTGMASIEEVRAAVEVIENAGAPSHCLFHCVSDYPALPADCNLRAMELMRTSFRCPVGWSDHTIGLHVSVAAAALGAELIEKHFTLDRSLPGPDHAASLEPSELAELVRQVREVESALGDGVKRRQKSEENTASVARRSLHAAQEIPKGRILTEDDFVSLRPGIGIPPHQLPSLIGRRATRIILRGEMLSKGDVE